MVCDECARKISNLVTVDDKSRRMYGKVKIEIKKLGGGKEIYNKCLSCKGRAEDKNKYCLTCAYRKGVCEMCGKQLTKNKMYKYNDVDEKDIKRKKKMMERSRIISEEIKKEKGIAELTKNVKKNKKIEIDSRQNKDNTNNENIKKEKKPFVPLFTEEDKKEMEDNKGNEVTNEEYDEIINL